MATRRSSSRPEDERSLTPRRRDRLAALFRPRSRSGREDHNSHLQATEQLTAAPLTHQQCEAFNVPQRETSASRPNDDIRERRRHENVLAGSNNLDSTHAVNSKDIWERAFQDLRLRESLLVEKFEKQLALIDQPDVPAESPESRLTLIERIVRQKLDEREARRLVFHIGSMPVRVRAVGENVVKTILWANEIIGGALSSQPYASLAWSTVSIILPVMLNSSKQNLAMVTGLESVAQLMQLFRIREDLYLSNSREKVPPEFVGSLVDLYRAIFEYQVRAVNHLSHHAIKRGFMATFEFDDWEMLLSKIRNANEHASAFIELFNAEREINQLSLIEKSGNIQDQILDMFHAFQDQRQRDRQEDKETRLMQSLASNYRGDKDFISKRIDGTCEWFFEDERFIRWRDITTSSLLWVSAGPGCGKSVLSRALIDENRLSKTVMTSTVCYFFFKDGQQQRTHGANALSAILHQLFRNPQLIRHGVPSHERFGDHISANSSELWDILVQTARDPDAGEVICIIDALDECDNCDENRCRDQFMGKIIEFFSYESLNENRSLCVKFLITSRPYEDLESKFERLPENICYIRFDGDEKSEQIGQEVNLVIDVKVKEFASSFALEHQRRIAERLKEMNNRTYLWLFLTMNIIEKAPRSKYGKPSSIEALLSSLPTEISQAYEAILNRTSDKKKARVLLQIIIVVTRPLSLAELNVALTLATQEPTCSSHEALDLWPQKDFGSVVKNVCGLLVIIHDEKLSLLHQTVREFLISQSATDALSDEDAWKGSIQLSDAHGLLGRVCLNYLTFSNFEFKDLSSPLDEYFRYDPDYGYHHEMKGSVSRSYPLLDYSIRHWVTHYKSQSHRFLSRSQTLAERLCYPDLLYLNVSILRRLRLFPNYALHKWPRLAIAAKLGLSDLVGRFLERGDAPNVEVEPVPGGAINTPLSIASKHGIADVVRVLLKAGADPKWQGLGGINPFNSAAGAGHIDTLQVFLDAGVDVSWHGEGAPSSLQLASRSGHLEVVEFLVRNNASLVSRECFYDHQALTEACSGGYQEIVEFLIEHGADVHVLRGLDNSAIHIACCAGSLSIVERLVAEGADLHVELDGGFKTTLQAACYTNSPDLVRYLIDHGLDVNAPAGDDGTALQVACRNQASDTDIEVIKLLVENGANVNVSQMMDGTPLQIACSSNVSSFETIKFLTENDADVNLTKGLYGTPLQIACRYLPGLEVIRILIENGADVNLTSNCMDDPPLQIACFQSRDVEVIKILIENGADVNSTEGFFGTPLQLACSQDGYLEVIKYLIENGADVNAMDDCDGTPLQLACCKSEDLEVIKFLIESGAHVNDRKGNRKSPLFFALHDGSDTHVVELLQKTGATLTESERELLDLPEAQRRDIIRAEITGLSR